MPRYELRNTTGDALTYAEGTLPLDLMKSQAAGTYRAKAMSTEEATDIVVPALTAAIVEASLEVGELATLTTNAPDNATYQWELDGTPIGSATSSSYVTAAEGTLTCVVSIPGNPQAPVETAGVTVGAAPSAGVTPQFFNIAEGTGSGPVTLNLTGHDNADDILVLIGYIAGNTSTSLDETAAACTLGGVNALAFPINQANAVASRPVLAAIRFPAGAYADSVDLDLSLVSGGSLSGGNFAAAAYAIPAGSTIGVIDNITTTSISNTMDLSGAVLEGDGVLGAYLHFTSSAITLTWEGLAPDGEVDLFSNDKFSVASAGDVVAETRTITVTGLGTFQRAGFSLYVRAA